MISTKAMAAVQAICSFRMSAESTMDRNGTRYAKFAILAESLAPLSASAHSKYATALTTIPNHATPAHCQPVIGCHASIISHETVEHTATVNHIHIMVTL